MYNDREILYFLQTIPGFGNRTIRNLWNYFSSGMELFQAEEEILKQLLKPSQVRAFLRERERQSPSDRMVQLQKKGIHYYCIFDWQYPIRLRAVADTPLALFVRGKLPTEEEMTAAVVGARYHSYYGEKNTREFSALLARNGIAIISGMAKGIDSIAQLAAIENGGSTYAVLGCGVDICYPEESRRLYDILPEHGGIISEYLPSTMPKAGLFPLRNRIISALGDILLVMEAKEKSGTLITVDMALEQGKEIWALPGRKGDVLSAGCNRLIAQGAGMLTGIEEFSAELECMKEKYGRTKQGIQTQGVISMTGEKEEAGYLKKMEVKCTTVRTEKPYASIEQQILELLSYAPLPLEAVYEEISRDGQAVGSIQELSVLLVDLCMRQKIKQIGGGYYAQK